ncbi:DUF1672 family protein [Sporosarcina sp. E16_8]|uniref:DUF1672 family protein n=1 Tax=Sporosarcina sp. E16_8 TaxID=2789295 RepID=UPI001A932C7D|nr:DUF1672 family protein [Sporosarcina sp. E16_8]MBO0589194.1 DUF1672 family protein [Sporosarcina sp. E16_8]
MDNLTSKEKVEVNEPSTKNKKNAYETENFVRIQDYTGEGYKLRDSRPETGQLAEENREEIEGAVKRFFISNYKTEVIVHNIVGAVDGASVFVESVGVPHFYTFAIVPIDVENKTVKLDTIRSQEGQVEEAIQGGLYAMAFEDKFRKLDKYLENVVETSPVVGTPIEAIENVMATGFSTPYYYVTTFDDIFDELYQVYLANPQITKKELTEFFNENSFNPKNLAITIEFYSKNAIEQPNKEVFNKIVMEIEQMEDIPRGEYSIYLNDNFIDKRRGIGNKDNTLERTTPDKILKE